MTRTQKFALVPLSAAVLLGGGAIAGYAGLAAAQTNTTQSGQTTQGHHGPPMGMDHMHGRGPGVMGTVSAINGTTITVTGKNGTTYTVNAASTTVDKVVQLSVGDIKVGDTIGVMGQVSGSSVTANHIMDGLAPHPQGNDNDADDSPHNGQPTQ